MEDIYDALSAVVNETGGWKTVAAELWPAMKLTSANTRLRNCLTAESGEKLAPHEIVWLLKRGYEQGYHRAMEFLADEIGYERPAPLVKEDEKARLQREFIKSVEIQKQILVQLEKL